MSTNPSLISKSSPLEPSWFPKSLADQTPRQLNFRQKAIQAYNAYDSKEYLVWCPVMARHYTAHATQIVPTKLKSQSFAAIFGANIIDPFSPKNSLLLEPRVLDVFDCGLLALVPDVEDDSEESIKRWNEQDAKEYKLCIINREHPIAKRPVNWPHKETWLDFDGRKLRFRNDFRPDPRYLFFHYCCQLLRNVWAGVNLPTQPDGKLKKNFWGPAGRYLPKNMLQSLLYELGPQYRHILNGAAASSLELGQDDMLVDALRKQIHGSDDEDDEDDEDDSEQYYEICPYCYKDPKESVPDVVGSREPAKVWTLKKGSVPDRVESRQPAKVWTIRKGTVPDLVRSGEPAKLWTVKKGSMPDVVESRPAKVWSAKKGTATNSGEDSDWEFL